MTVDRKRFDETVNKRKEEHHISEVLHLVHAAVPIEKVTQSPEWNSFLQLIEGLIENEQRKYETLHKQLVDPNTVNTDKIMLLKQQITASLSRIEAWIEARDLPGKVLTAADKAKRNI